MLNPRPVEPRWIKTLRGSLEKRTLRLWLKKGSSPQTNYESRHAAAVKCTSVAGHRSPGDVVVSQHAVQDGGKSAGRGGSEGLRVIRAKVVGVAELRVHVRICCARNRGKIHYSVYGKVHVGAAAS